MLTKRYMENSQKCITPAQEESEINILRAQEYGYEIPTHECPMCRFIRRGPCFKEYFAYDACNKAERAAQQLAEANASGIDSPSGEKQHTSEQQSSDTLNCLSMFQAMLECMKKNRPYYAPMLDYFDELEQEERRGEQPPSRQRRLWELDEQGRFVYTSTTVPLHVTRDDLLT